MGAMNDPYYSRSAGRNGNYPSPRVWTTVFHCIFTSYQMSIDNHFFFFL
jgi:hypothetical protein